MKRPALAVAAFAGSALIVGGILIATRPRPWQAPPLKIDHPKPSVSPAEKEREALDDLAVKEPKSAETRYRAFVASNEHSADPKVQEQVGLAKFRIGYLRAKVRDYVGAREVFLDASRKYKGDGSSSGDFGGVKDGADYQAAVCLLAEGKKDEARQAFIEFMKREPESPLAKACYRRLVMLNGGKSVPGYEKLLQSDLSAQQANEKFEMASCGPRCLQYLLPLLGKPKRDYKGLARLCKTGDGGTTMEGLRDALKTFGVKSYGLAVNRKDFSGLPTPLILADGMHYFVATHISTESVHIYDPARLKTGPEYDLPLPPIDDPEFSAVCLVFSPPSLSTDGSEGSSDEQHRDLGKQKIGKPAAPRKRVTPRLIDASHQEEAGKIGGTKPSPADASSRGGRH